MEATLKQVNDAAAILRIMVDERRDNLIDHIGLTFEEAEFDCKPQYDAITLLHEQAQKEVL